MSDPTTTPRRARADSRLRFPIVVAVLVVILIAAIVTAVMLLRDPGFAPIPIPSVSSV